MKTMRHRGQLCVVQIVELGLCLGIYGCPVVSFVAE